MGLLYLYVIEKTLNNYIQTIIYRKKQKKAMESE